jgi:hypothetical protein
MLRLIATSGVVLAMLAVAACGHQAVAPTSTDGATLGTYVMDATTTDPSSPPPYGQAGAAPARGPGSAQAAITASACGQGQGAFKVLAFLVSSDTGVSVQTMEADLRNGQTLSDIAGSQTGQVKQQGIDLVQAYLQFARANGKLTADQVTVYRATAAAVIDALMNANVASCVPAVG